MRSRNLAYRPLYGSAGCRFSVLAPQGWRLTVRTGLWSQRPARKSGEVVDGFTKETGIKVTLRNGDDSELGNQLVQEGAASPADVFLTENSPSMVLVDNAKLFAPLDGRPAAGSGTISPSARSLDWHRRA